jgi:hypothetical protein
MMTRLHALMEWASNNIRRYYIRVRFRMPVAALDAGRLLAIDTFNGAICVGLRAARQCAS